MYQGTTSPFLNCCHFCFSCCSSSNDDEAEKGKQKEEKNEGEEEARGREEEKWEKEEEKNKRSMYNMILNTRYNLNYIFLKILGISVSEKTQYEGRGS